MYPFTLCYNPAVGVKQTSGRSSVVAFNNHFTPKSSTVGTSCQQNQKAVLRSPTVPCTGLYERYSCWFSTQYPALSGNWSAQLPPWTDSVPCWIPNEVLGCDSSWHLRRVLTFEAPFWSENYGDSHCASLSVPFAVTFSQRLLSRHYTHSESTFHV